MPKIKSKIPKEILQAILNIYAYGVSHTYFDPDGNEIPNTICEKWGGEVWTTWDEIFKIRDIHHKKLRERFANAQLP